VLGTKSVSPARQPRLKRGGSGALAGDRDTSSLRREFRCG
jgi:hypothetical protein